MRLLDLKIYGNFQRRQLSQKSGRNWENKGRYWEECARICVDKKVLHGNIGKDGQGSANGSCNLRRPPQEVAASHYNKRKDKYGRREATEGEPNQSALYKEQQDFVPTTSMHAWLQGSISTTLHKGSRAFRGSVSPVGTSPTAKATRNVKEIPCRVPGQRPCPSETSVP